MSATLAPGDLPLTQPLCDRARHEPLGGLAWGAARAGDAIATIGRAAAGAFDWERRWPRGHAPGRRLRVLRAARRRAMHARRSGSPSVARRARTLLARRPSVGGRARRRSR